MTSKTDLDEFGFEPIEKEDELVSEFGFEPMESELSTDRMAASLSDENISEGFSDFLQGAKQGLTFGGADELGGGIQSGLDRTQRLLNKLGIAGPSPTQVNEMYAQEGFTGDIGPTSPEELYEQGRQEELARYRKAKERSPILTTAGDVSGAVISPLGIAGKAAGLAGAGLRSLVPAAKGIQTLGKAGAGVGAVAAESGVMSALSADDQNQIDSPDRLVAFKEGFTSPMNLLGALGAGAKAPVKTATQTNLRDGRLKGLIDSYRFSKEGKDIMGGRDFQDKLFNLTKNDTEDFLQTLRKTHVDNIKNKQDVLESNIKVEIDPDLVTDIKSKISNALEISDKTDAEFAINKARNFLNPKIKNPTISDNVLNYIENPRVIQSPQERVYEIISQLEGADLSNQTLDIISDITQYPDALNKSEIASEAFNRLSSAIKNDSLIPRNVTVQDLEKARNILEPYSFGNKADKTGRAAYDAIVDELYTKMPELKPLNDKIRQTQEISKTLTGKPIAKLGDYVEGQVNKLDEDAKAYLAAKLLAINAIDPGSEKFRGVLGGGIIPGDLDPNKIQNFDKYTDGGFTKFLDKVGTKPRQYELSTQMRNSINTASSSIGTQGLAQFGGGTGVLQQGAGILGTGVNKASIPLKALTEDKYTFEKVAGPFSNYLRDKGYTQYADQMVKALNGETSTRRALTRALMFKLMQNPDGRNMWADFQNEVGISEEISD